MSEHAHEHAVGSCEIPHFHTRELIVREDIIAKAKELAALLTTSSEVEFYKKAEKLVTHNNEVQQLIKAIKKKQKEAVAFESMQNQKMVQKIEAEIDQLQDRLDDFPIVNQFKQAQDDINYLLQLTISVIRDTVSEQINVESASTDTSASQCSD
jgi:cell fate (sporulation/competence/biofilm development) regulator YmcA (YheA/YmcA/DUF963 family)